MDKLDFPVKLPEEAAIWLLENGSGLKVKPHPQKVDVWFVIQEEGLYTCTLSYNNKKGNLYLSGATHIIMAIKKLLGRYLDAGRRGKFLDAEGLAVQFESLWFFYEISVRWFLTYIRRILTPCNMYTGSWTVSPLFVSRKTCAQGFKDCRRSLFWPVRLFLDSHSAKKTLDF